MAIVTLINLGYSQNSPTKKNGWETDNLRGKVKSYTQSSYDSAERFGEIQEIQKIDGSLFNKETYKYDTKGNLIEDNSYYSDSSLNCKWTYKYDDKDNRIEANGYSANGSFNEKYINKYDDKDNRIEAIWYKSDGKLEFKYIMKYDYKSNLIEKNGYNADGSLEYKRIFKYEFDEKGNWIKKISFKNQIPENIKEREYEYYE